MLRILKKPELFGPPVVRSDKHILANWKIRIVIGPKIMSDFPIEGDRLFAARKLETNAIGASQSFFIGVLFVMCSKDLLPFPTVFPVTDACPIAQASTLQ